MLNINKMVKRRQVALLIALVLGVGVGGGVSWYVSNLNMKKNAVQKKPKEPAPDMTGVVNQTFDNKVQQSAIAQAQQLHKETQQQIKSMRSEVQALSRDLKDNQGRMSQVEEENKLLQTQLDAYQNAADNGEPLPGMLSGTPDGKTTGSGHVPPPTNFWPGQATGADGRPVLTPVVREGQLDTTEFTEPADSTVKPKFPWIHSGSFAEAIIIEGADANASVTGDKSTVPMQLRITGSVQMPNDNEFDLNGCFITLEAYGDVSSERAEVRSRSISCQIGEDTIDMKIAGHVSFMGKNGIKGEVVMRNGKILGFAFGAGFLDGIGKGIEQASSTTVGIGATASASGADIAQSGFGGGTSQAAKTLSDYYIKRAEQYHPVIPIGAGNEVTMVFQDGFQLETVQEARLKKVARNTATQQPRQDVMRPTGTPTNTTDMLKQLKDFQVGDSVEPVPGQVAEQ